MIHFVVSLPGHGDKTQLERFRKIFKESLAEHYEGWSDEHDRKLDGNTVLLQLIDDGEDKPLATCRIISREGGPLPMEKGDRSAYLPEGKKGIVEASGFWYSERSHGLVLLIYVMDYLLDNGVEQGFVIYDPTSPIRRLYIDLLGLTPVPGKIIYSSFKWRATGQAVQWGILTGDPQTFKAAKSRLLLALAAEHRRLTGGVSRGVPSPHKLHELGAGMNPEGSVHALRVGPYCTDAQGELASYLFVREP